MPRIAQSISPEFHFDRTHSPTLPHTKEGTWEMYEFLWVQDRCRWKRKGDGDGDGDGVVTTYLPFTSAEGKGIAIGKTGIYTYPTTMTSFVERRFGQIPVLSRKYIHSSYNYSNKEKSYKLTPILYKKNEEKFGYAFIYVCGSYGENGWVQLFN